MAIMTILFLFVVFVFWGENNSVFAAHNSGIDGYREYDSSNPHLQCSSACPQYYRCMPITKETEHGLGLVSSEITGHHCVWNSGTIHRGKRLYSPQNNNCSSACPLHHRCAPLTGTKLINDPNAFTSTISVTIAHWCLWDFEAEHNGKKLYSPQNNNCHNQCVLGTRCVGAEGVDGHQCRAIYKGRDFYDNENCSEQCDNDTQFCRRVKRTRGDTVRYLGWYCSDGTGSSEAEEYCDPAYEICNPINSTSFINLISRIIDYFTIIAGSVLTLMVVYAGFLYTTSAGSTTQTDRAKNVIKHAVIGFIIITLAYVIKSIIGDIL